MWSIIFKFMSDPGTKIKGGSAGTKYSRALSVLLFLCNLTSVKSSVLLWHRHKLVTAFLLLLCCRGYLNCVVLMKHNFKHFFCCETSLAMKGCFKDCCFHPSPLSLFSTRSSAPCKTISFWIRSSSHQSHGKTTVDWAIIICGWKGKGNMLVCD